MGTQRRAEALTIIQTKGDINMIKKLMTVALIASSMTLAACNTVRGAGQDAKSVGDAAEKAVK